MILIYPYSTGVVAAEDFAQRDFGTPVHINSMVESVVQNLGRPLARPARHIGNDSHTQTAT